jgi:DnaJ-class molecular chaperone
LIGADIDEWLRKNQNNIRTMLANLADVLWEGHGYKSPDLNDLLSPNAVKKSYHKALVIIHPDKVRQKFGGDMDKVFVADKVFDQVRDAYKAFSEKEL